MTKIFLNALKVATYDLIVSQYLNILKIGAGVALGAWLF